jgi:hypothetical protein
MSPNSQQNPTTPTGGALINIFKRERRSPEAPQLPNNDIIETLDSAPNEDLGNLGKRS